MNNLDGPTIPTDLRVGSHLSCTMLVQTQYTTDAVRLSQLKLYLQTNASFANKWINAHVKAATGLGKPLLLEEFGKVEPREDFYNAVLDVSSHPA